MSCCDPVLLTLLTSCRSPAFLAMWMTKVRHKSMRMVPQ